VQLHDILGQIFEIVHKRVCLYLCLDLCLFLLLLFHFLSDLLQELLEGSFLELSFGGEVFFRVV